MSSMTDSNTAATERAESRLPKRLGRRNDQAMNDMLKRVMPPTVDDDGVSPLDVCAFNSSI